MWHFYCFMSKVFKEHLEHKMSLGGGLVMTIKVIDKHDFDILILILGVIFEIIFLISLYG